MSAEMESQADYEVGAMWGFCLLAWHRSHHYFRASRIFSKLLWQAETGAMWTGVKSLEGMPC